MEDLVRTKREQILRLARRHGVTAVRVFGSMLDAYDLAGRRRDTCDIDAGIGGCRSLMLGPLLRAPLAVTDVSAQVTCTSSRTLRGASRRAT